MTKKRKRQPTANSTWSAKKMKIVAEKIISSISSNNFNVLAPFFSKDGESTLLDSYVNDTFLKAYIKQLANLKLGKGKPQDTQLWYIAAIFFRFSQQQLGAQLKTKEDYQVILKIIQFSDQQPQVWIKRLCKEKLIPLVSQFIVKLEDKFKLLTKLTFASIEEMDWYFTHSSTLFPLTENQADYLNIVKKLLGLFQKTNPEIKQKSFVIIYKHPEFFSNILNMLLNKYQEKSILEEHKDLIKPFLVEIELFDNSLVNLSSYLNLLEIYLVISPKLYPIALYKEDYIQIYINLCALYSKTQHKDITSFIESHRTFFLELTNECMFSHMSEAYAKEQLTGLTAPLLESTFIISRIASKANCIFSFNGFCQSTSNT